jgi:hypothetical protein
MLKHKLCEFLFLSLLLSYFLSFMYSCMSKNSMPLEQCHSILFFSHPPHKFGQPSENYMKIRIPMTHCTNCNFTLNVMQQRNVNTHPPFPNHLKRKHYLKEKLVILLPIWDQYVKWTHHFFSSVNSVIVKGATNHCCLYKLCYRQQLGTTIQHNSTAVNEFLYSQGTNNNKFNLSSFH